MSAPAAGRLYGIGVGPGDPELLTLKAVRLIRAADVLAYVAPDGRPSLARAIAAPHLPGGQRELAIPVPMDPDARLARDPARAEPLAAELSAGRDVALLCEGDPLLYGSFIHLFARLAGRFAVEVVPGVTAITAAAAAALLPLAARDATLTVLPATLPAGRLADHLRRADAAAVLKLGRHLGKLRAVLADLNLLDGATYVERATQPGQRVLPLAALEGDAAPYFSLALVVRR
ncbi:MAG TPA: precorrin-2 C(20)-methyltransferase [Geminicoccaceae bacterium]|nr:precorrin-2 C(20)-methyltransferase [Geminicoccaceae bacterium]